MNNPDIPFRPEPHSGQQDSHIGSFVDFTKQEIQQALENRGSGYLEEEKLHTGPLLHEVAVDFVRKDPENPTLEGNILAIPRLSSARQEQAQEQVSNGGRFRRLVGRLARMGSDKQTMELNTIDPMAAHMYQLYKTKVREGTDQVHQAVEARRVIDSQAEQISNLRIDATTGLPTKPVMVEDLARILAGRRPNMFVAFCDINGLKRANDMGGHETGDQLLKDVADILRQTLRQGDKAYRIGGDEIVIIGTHESALHETELKEAFAKREDTITDRLRNKYEQFVVGLSIGVVPIDHAKNMDASGIVQLADDEMYERKQHFYASLPVDVQMRIERGPAYEAAMEQMRNGVLLARFDDDPTKFGELLEAVIKKRGGQLADSNSVFRLLENGDYELTDRVDSTWSLFDPKNKKPRADQPAALDEHSLGVEAPDPEDDSGK